ncbi:hypothetical protein ACO2Q0_02815 [Phenylobacterium sp. VNQ135]|uniref:hypothetical protein n=1 Tax=Phenylobacterium sp. VNQ135 TaxID=3400922 RepID=UPI003BFFDE14
MAEKEPDPWAKFSPEEKAWLLAPPTRSEVYRLFLQITVILGRLSAAGGEGGDRAEILSDAERRLEKLREELSRIPGMDR